MPQGNLPPGAKKIFDAAEAAAKKGTCKDSGERQDECAARVAWAAVKKKYKKVGDKWVKKDSDALAQFSMAIVKAPFDNDTGEMKWRSVNSDTEEDSYNDEMTMELFADFMQRIEAKAKPPEKFCSDFWNGGKPYLSISHYPDLNGTGVPGEVEEIFVDGNKLKSFGKFYDTKLGRACWKSIRKDLMSEERSDAENKIRISIAFLDWMHEHKSNGFVFDRAENPEELCPECFKELILSLVDGEEPKGKKFLRGQLIHLAMTRVPVNTRTLMEVDKSMVDEIKTRLDDASSIVGEEEAQKLEELATEMLQSESLVIKSEVEEEKGKGKDKMKEKEEEEEDDEEEMKDKKKSEVSEPDLAQTLAEIKSMLASKQEVPEPHPLDEAIAKLKATYDEALSVDFSAEESLQLIQDPFNELGTLLRDTVSNKPSGEPETKEGAEEKEIVRVLSAIASRLESVEQTQGMIQAQLSSGGVTKVSEMPQRRSIQPPVQTVPPELAAQQRQQKSATPKLRALVEQSVGLRQ